MHEIRVFLSSTFRDMHAERDHLVKFTFPAIRERLRPYRVELYDIDLRWGITENDAIDGKVVPLCLDQIDSCRPFFLAFIGHRYGSGAIDFTEETRNRFPIVESFNGASITELELRHGVLNSTSVCRALILLRTPESLASIPEEARNRDYTEACPIAQARLEQLRTELNEGPFPVQPYSAFWNANLFDRINNCWGKLDGLASFGEAVESWLWESIRKDLKLPDTPPQLDSVTAEAEQHEHFSRQLTRVYHGRDHLYEQLKEFALQRGDKSLLLTGPSGIGKSAALARFVRDFRKEHPTAYVLPHFVGASSSTATLPATLERLTIELKRRFQLTLKKSETPADCIRDFNIAINIIPDDVLVVLVIDGLDQLDSDGRAESLYWLPERLPTNLRIICSVATGLSRVSEYVSDVRKRDCDRIDLRPLTLEEQKMIVRDVPKLVAKTLDDRQVELLLSNDSTANPLYLMVALEELRGCGSFMTLNQHIESLSRGSNSLPEIFNQVLERLEHEFGGQLVNQVLRLLACARRGLSSLELESLTSGVIEAAENLYPLLRQLRPYLQSRDGLLRFHHASLVSAVGVRYLEWQNNEGQLDPWARWKIANMPTPYLRAPESETRSRLLAFFSRDICGDRAIDEIPWHLSHLREWQRLSDQLADINFFNAAFRADPWTLKESWSLVKEVGRLDPLVAYRDALNKFTSVDLNEMYKLESFARWLFDIGEGKHALPFYSRLLDLFRSSKVNDGLRLCLGNVGILLRSNGSPDEAMALYKEQEAICRKENDLTALQACLGNQGVLLGLQGDLAGAELRHREEEAICRQTGNFEGLQGCLGNLSGILVLRNDFQGAMELLKEQQTICERLNNPDGLARCFGQQSHCCFKQGNLSEAMILLKKAESLFRRFNNWRGMYTSLQNQALILLEQKNLEPALSIMKECEAFMRQSSNLEGLQGCLWIQASAHIDQGEQDTALDLLREQEAICRKTESEDLWKCLRLQASIQKTRGNLREAFALLKEQEAWCRQMGALSGLYLCIEDQIEILNAQGNTQAALVLQKEQEAIDQRVRKQVRLERPRLEREAVLQSIGDRALSRIEHGTIEGAIVELAKIFDPDVMVPVWEEAESKQEPGDDPKQLQFNLALRAFKLQAQFDFEGAFLLFKQIETICRKHDIPEGLQNSLGNQAFFLQLRGDRDGAMVLLREQESICRKINFDIGLCTCLGVQASILASLGDLEGARKRIDEAEAVARRLKDSTQIASVSLIKSTLGDGKQKSGRTDRPEVTDITGLIAKLRREHVHSKEGLTTKIRQQHNHFASNMINSVIVRFILSIAILYGISTIDSPIIRLWLVLLLALGFIMFRRLFSSHYLR